MAGNSSGFLAALPEYLLPILEAEASRKRYDNGQQIHQRGEKNPALSIIRKGHARFGSLSACGTFVEFGRIGPGDVYGEMTVAAGHARIHDGYAVGTTEIDHIPAEKFRALLNQHPDLQAVFLRLMAKRLQLAYQRIDDILRLPLIDRIGNFLIETKRRQQGDSAITLKQSEVAEAMAASRVSVSKCLALLNGHGFVDTGYNQIHLTDEAGLKNWLKQREKIGAITP
jgi:CRP/FNR family transcriptional regulator, cyclic AMP receptor protein